MSEGGGHEMILHLLLCCGVGNFLCNVHMVRQCHENTETYCARPNMRLSFFAFVFYDL